MQIFLWFLAVLSIIGVGLLTYRADKRRVVPYPALTATLRALVLALVWALLLAPNIQIAKTETEQPIIVLLQDASTSIPAALKGDTLSYGTATRALLQKLGQKCRVVTWGFGSHVAADSPFQYQQHSTDIAEALANVQDYYGNQNLAAVILASDGRYNAGLHPLYQNLALKAPVYSIAIGDTALPIDLKLTQVYANKRVNKDAQIEIRADLVATRCRNYKGEVQLLEGSTQLAVAPVSITSDKYDQQLSFSIKAGAVGLHHYVLAVPAAKGESLIANNRKDVFIEVVAQKKKILIASAAPHPDIAAIRNALSETDNYSITLSNSIPEEYGAYDIIILHGLPRAGSTIDLKNKSVWYLLTPESGPLPETLARAVLQPALQRDAYAQPNPSFNYFKLPDGLQSLLDKMPPLSVASGSVTPGVNSQVLLTDKASNSPLWMIQSGNVPKALLLGEGLWRWRLYEYRFFHKHAVVDELIRQTVATLSTNLQDAPFRVSLPKYEWTDGEQVNLDAFLLNTAGEQINTPDASIEIIDSSGGKQIYPLERNGANYHLNIGSMPGGSYTYHAFTTFNGKKLESSGAFIVQHTPIEALESGADFQLLYQLAKKYGGTAVTAPQLASLYDTIFNKGQIKPLLRERSSSLPLVDWKWYFFFILLVATVEWLLRKYWLAQ